LEVITNDVTDGKSEQDSMPKIRATKSFRHFWLFRK